jgi:long-chain acyl-CoA synthetase
VKHDGKDWRFMGIQSKNRKEWNIVHLAGMYNNATTIALYDTLGVDAIKFVVNQTELTTIACSIEFVDKFATMILEEQGQATKKLHRIKNIVSFEKVLDGDIIGRVNKAGLNLYSYDEVMAAGLNNQSSFTPRVPGYEDCFMLSYTSGTTGDPKGVQLTHKMIMNCVGAMTIRNGSCKLGPSDTYISYLPAAHSFEQCLFSMALVSGMRCGYFGGDVLKMISHDIPTLKPTFFPSVPRLYNRIYGKI